MNNTLSAPLPPTTHCVGLGGKGETTWREFVGGEELPSTLSIAGNHHIEHAVRPLLSLNF